MKTGLAKWSPSISRIARVRWAPRGSRSERALQLGGALLAEVLDGGEHQVVLGREVVQLGTPADPGPLGDQRRRRAREAALDQALHGRVEQPLAHGARALLLRDTDRGHPVIVPPN